MASWLTNIRVEFRSDCGGQRSDMGSNLHVVCLRRLGAFPDQGCASCAGCFAGAGAEVLHNRVNGSWIERHHGVAHSLMGRRGLARGNSQLPTAAQPQATYLEVESVHLWLRLIGLGSITLN